MSRFRSSFPKLPLVLLITGCLASAGATTVAAGEGKPGGWPHVFVKEPFTAMAVRWSLEGAFHRLGSPGCQAVLADFKDQEGRLLSERLAELNQTAPGYLGLLFFRDGSDEKPCRRDGVMAFTAPGSRIVFVCGRRFSRAWEQSAPRAQAMLIHELLHTLGLGENPPTSTAITQGVIRRCGG